MSKSLKKHCGSVSYVRPFSSYRDFFGNIINKISHAFLRKNYDFKRSVAFSNIHGEILSKVLHGRNFDVIFGIASSPYLAYLDTSVPLVYTSDSTFRLMHNYYSGFSNLANRCVKAGNYLERMTLEKAKLALYPSEWAAASAINDYNADEKKIHVIPYGANFHSIDIPNKEEIIAKKKTDCCRLLFLGVDWDRKGGDLAYKTLLELLQLQVPARLTVCGCSPSTNVSHDFMTVIPYLDKNDQEQRAQLTTLLLESDFLLVPTRSEAYGLVFCEANAFGLPAIATNTGGVSGIIDHGRNGFLFPMSASASDYAKCIRSTWENSSIYYKLVRSSREAYDERLNWDVWGKTVRELLEEFI